MTFALREVRVTYGWTALLPLLAGIALAAWILADESQSQEHARVALPTYELVTPLLFAFLGTRVMGRDIGLGCVEILAVRGPGYPGRVLWRSLLLALLLLVSTAAPLASILSVVDANPLELLVACTGGVLLLSTASGLGAAVARSELVGLAGCITWWMANVFFLRDFPTGMPAGLLNLLAFQVSTDESWVAVKFGQILLALVLASIFVVSSSRLSSLALTRPAH